MFSLSLFLGGCKTGYDSDFHCKNLAGTVQFLEERGFHEIMVENEFFGGFQTAKFFAMTLRNVSSWDMCMQLC